MSVTVHVPDDDALRSTGGGPVPPNDGGRLGLAAAAAPLTVTDRGTNAGFLTGTGDADAGGNVGIDLPGGLEALTLSVVSLSLLLLSSSP